MPWSGANLKALAKEKGITLTKLSELLKVSRQTVTAWTKDKVPKGDHLIELSKILEINPGYFFTMMKLKELFQCLCIGKGGLQK